MNGKLRSEHLGQQLPLHSLPEARGYQGDRWEAFHLVITMLIIHPHVTISILRYLALGLLITTDGVPHTGVETENYLRS